MITPTTLKRRLSDGIVADLKGNAATDPKKGKRSSGRGIVFFLGMTAFLLVFCASSHAFSAQKTLGIHMGSFKDRDNAARLVRILARHGHDAYALETSSDDGEQWAKVFVGGYSMRVRAEEALERLRKSGYSGYCAIATVPMAESLDGLGSKTVVRHKRTFVPRTLSRNMEEKSVQEERKNHGQDVFSASDNEISSRSLGVELSGKRQTFANAIIIQNRLIPTGLLFPAALDQKKEEKPLLFSLSAMAGYSFLPHVDDFVITRQTGNQAASWRIGDDGTGHLGVEVDVPIVENVTYYGGVETQLYEDIDLYYVSVGAKVACPLVKTVAVMAKGGLVYGYFDWDGPPGDFDDDFGLELGAAVEYRMGRVVLGMEALYRAVKFEYEPPAGLGVSSSASEIDFSGYILSGTLGYSF